MKVRTVMATAALLVAGSCSLIAATSGSAQTRFYHSCSMVQTKKITGIEVETTRSFGCSGAQNVMRSYFKLVVSTGQTAGGCAQERATKGCKIESYRCHTIYQESTNELRGSCHGPKGKVRFNEIDRGPN